MEQSWDAWNGPACLTPLHHGSAIARLAGLAASSTPRHSGRVARLLVEAVLTGGERSSAPLADVVRHPALFPFALRVTGGELRNAVEFRVDLEGLDVDVVGLGVEL